MAKTKFQKSYSLTTEAIHLIALAAKKDARTPSDWLDMYITKNLQNLKLNKKSKHVGI